VYRGEAAALMAAAAGDARTQPAAPMPARGRKPAPPVRAESRGPLPYPEPVGFNDNFDDVDAGLPPRLERRRLSPARLAARIVIAPLYVAVAAGTVGIIALAIVAMFAG